MTATAKSDLISHIESRTVMKTLGSSKHLISILDIFSQPGGLKVLRIILDWSEQTKSTAKEIMKLLDEPGRQEICRMLSSYIGSEADIKSIKEMIQIREAFYSRNGMAQSSEGIESTNHTRGKIVTMPPVNEAVTEAAGKQPVSPLVQFLLTWRSEGTSKFMNERTDDEILKLAEFSRIKLETGMDHTGFPIPDCSPGERQGFLLVIKKWQSRNIHKSNESS